MLKIIKKNQKGFTMVELLVSIAIIALMSAIFIPSYRSSGKTSKLNMAAQKLASDIRLMQGYSVGLKDFDFNDGNGLVPPSGGWGVYFEAANVNNYIFYADSGDMVCDGGCNVASDDYYRTIQLPEGITISNLTYNGGGNPPQLQISFAPPNPDVNICRVNAGQCDSNTGEIILSNGSITKTIVINKFGLVDVSS